MDKVILAVMIVILLFMFELGYRKGIVKLLVSFVATILAVILAMILMSPMEQLIKDTPVYDSMKKGMTEYVSKHMEAGIETTSIEMQKDAISELEIPSVVKKKLEKEYTPDKKLDLGVNTVSEYVAVSLADVLVRATAVIILYLVIKIALTVLVTAFDLISRLPLVHGVNKCLGGMVGLAEGIVIIWLICFVLTMFGTTALGTKMLEAISSNSILNFIYSSNPIMKLILK